jgi:hypothetical protein
MGKGSKRRDAQVPESTVETAWAQSMSADERRFPPQQPRCEECKHRHDPSEPCVEA